MINNNYVGVKTLNSLSYLYEKKNYIFNFWKLEIVLLNLTRPVRLVTW